MKVLYAVKAELIPKVFGQIDIDRIAQMCEVIDAPIPEIVDKEFLLKYVADANVIISSWDTAQLDADVMATAKNLKLLTHAAGSVKPVVSNEVWQGGVKVTSSAAAISFGVAEFCLGFILMAPKRAFWAGRFVQQGLWSEGIKFCNGSQEIYQENIGVIGASHVGRHLIKLLQNFTCNVLLYDPYCSAEKAAEMGATKIETLEELFEKSLVVSLNAPSTEQTKHMIRGKHFQLLRDGAVFINTARGAIVHEQEMIDELREGRFLACLDVTDPEPPLMDSPLRQLPNVWLTPHEAGVTAQNMKRIGMFVADEIQALLKNRDLNYEVTEQMLANIG